MVEEGGYQPRGPGAVVVHQGGPEAVVVHPGGPGAVVKHPGCPGSSEIHLGGSRIHQGSRSKSFRKLLPIIAPDLG